MNSNSLVLGLSLAVWCGLATLVAGGQDQKKDPGIAQSPDKQLVAVANGTAITILDAASQKELRRFQGHTAKVNAVAFSPDGRRLASGAQNGQINMWDHATGRLLWTFKGPQPVLSVQFSMDGKMLIYRDAKMATFTMNVATGERLQAPLQ
jgi:WD40 repeat protein